MEELKFISLKDKKKINNKVKRLYNDSFPIQERMPFWTLKFLSKKETVKFHVIYDKDELIGLIYIICYKDIVFIFYLTIDKNFRGRGYGSKILQIIKQKYENYRIVLNIEETDPNSSNYKQRLKRKEFYIKNGFYNLDYTIKELNVVYEMLCYNKENKQVKKEEYMNLMKEYFGNLLYKIFYKRISQ